MHLIIKNLPKFSLSLVSIINNQKSYTIIGFSLFFGWLLAVPFEGQVFYQLLALYSAEGTINSTWAIAAHFFGLFIAGFFIKKQIAAKMTMITAAVVCISGSLIFFLPFSILWYIALITISFFSGLFVASWGYYFKIYASSGQRFRIAADVIICSSLIMILLNVLATNMSALIALATSIVGLLGALLLTFRLEGSSLEKPQPMSQLESKVHQKKPAKSVVVSLSPLVMLSAFILIITINSGLMYQVVNPAFSHFPVLTSYYWAVPYILALLILRNLPTKTNLAYLLYVALAMIGISYILFMLLDRSVSSYLIVNTLMLGAFGVFDLFWWSILGSFFDYYDNPVQVWGVGLSMNVLGILIGGFIGSVIIAEGDYFIASIIALIVILIVVTLLPILNNQLTRILKNHAFLMDFSNLNVEEQDKAMADFVDKKQLTEREMEIAKLLLQGYTYKAVSENLIISENTIKFHIKNIYQKLNIKSKMELIKLFADEDKQKQ